MAKLVPVKAGGFCFLSRNRTALTSPLNNCNFRLRSSKHSFKFRVVCSVREKENVKDSEKRKVVPDVLTGVNADGLEKRISSKDFEDQRELGFHWNWPPWKNIPQRYKIIGTTSLAFVVCNMDKVNLSIAIIPMSHQFGWNASTAGLVQSSFFWGCALSQLPGGGLPRYLVGGKFLSLEY